MEKAFEFTGQEGEFLQGVPRGDLSDDDYANLSSEQRDILVRNISGPAPLYKKAARAKDHAMKPATDPEAQESPKGARGRQGRSGRQGEGPGEAA